MLKAPGLLMTGDDSESVDDTLPVGQTRELPARIWPSLCKGQYITDLYYLGQLKSKK